MPLIVLTLALAFGTFAYTAWWCYRVWPRLWRVPRTAFDRLVYRGGARGWGLSMWIGTSLVLPAYRGYQAHQPWPDVGLRLLVVGVLMLPISLWAGHWWGRAVAASRGVKDVHPPADTTSGGP